MPRSNGESIRIVLTPEETVALRALLRAAPSRRFAQPRTLIACGLCVALLTVPFLLGWVRPDLIDQAFQWVRQVPAGVYEASQREGKIP